MDFPAARNCSSSSNCVAPPWPLFCSRKCSERLVGKNAVTCHDAVDSSVRAGFPAAMSYPPAGRRNKVGNSRNDPPKAFSHLFIAQNQPAMTQPVTIIWWRPGRSDAGHWPASTQCAGDDSRSYLISASHRVCGEFISGRGHGRAEAIENFMI